MGLSKKVDHPGNLSEQRAPSSRKKESMSNTLLPPPWIWRIILMPRGQLCMQTKGYSKQELLQCETFSILKKVCKQDLARCCGFGPLLHSVVGLHDVAWCFRRPQGLMFHKPNPVFGVRFGDSSEGIPIPQGERAVEGIWNWHKELLTSWLISDQKFFGT